MTVAVRYIWEVQWSGTTWATLENVRSFELEYGASPTASARGVEYRPAYGRISTDTAPAGAVAGIRPCRLRAENNLLWTGTVKYQGPRNTGRGVTVYEMWLASRYDETLRSPFRHHFTDNNLAAVANEVEELTGLEVTMNVDQPCGPVVASGTVRDFVSQLGRFGCGYMIEDADGNAQFRGYEGLSSLPVNGFDVNYRASADLLSREQLDLHIRSCVIAEARRWTPSPDVSTVATTEAVIPSNTTARLIVDIPFRTAERIEEVQGVGVESAVRGPNAVDPPPALTLVSSAVVPGGVALEVSCAAYTGDDITFTITIGATVSTLETVGERQLMLGSGGREYLVEPWFTQSFGGLYSRFLPFLDRLNDGGPRYVSLTYPSRQTTLGRSLRVARNLRPGSRVSAALGSTVGTVEFVVLLHTIHWAGPGTQVEHQVEGYEAAPRPTVTGHAQISEIGEDRASVTFGFPTAQNNRLLRYRYRTSGAWITRTVRVNGHSAAVRLDGLTPGAGYSVQASWAANFSPVVASGTWTTLAAVPAGFRLPAVNVSVDGGPPTAYTLFAGGFTTAGLIRRAVFGTDSVTVGVTVTTQPGARASVTPATRTLTPGGDPGEYEINVTRSGTTRTYRLSVVLSGQRIQEITTLGEAGNTMPNAIAISPSEGLAFVLNRARISVDTGRVYAYGLGDGVHRNADSFDIPPRAGGNVAQVNTPVSGMVYARSVAGRRDFIISARTSNPGANTPTLRIVEVSAGGTVTTATLVRWGNAYGSGSIWYMQPWSIIGNNLYAYMRFPAGNAGAVLRYTLGNLGDTNARLTVDASTLVRRNLASTGVLRQVISGVGVMVSDTVFWGRASFGPSSLSNYLGRWEVNGDGMFERDDSSIIELDSPPQGLALLGGDRLLWTSNADDAVYIQEI